MKIESVDFFYISMPEVFDIGDGSQDALLVRITAGGFEGWGECEASPLTSIASYVCPMSHSACKPIRYSVEGKQLNDVKDIERISAEVHNNSFDLLQASHTLSGIDIALWDLLGKKLNEPVYRLLGYEKSFPKMAYASQLFGNTSEETFIKAIKAKTSGYKAVKFGWAGFGKLSTEKDKAHVSAAREALGNDILLMIDAGTVWNDDVALVAERLQAFKNVNAYWLEEPFTNLELNAYKKLSSIQPSVALAAGEGCSNFQQAMAMMNHAGISFIQIDAGRIGGITVAKKIADAAQQKGITYVNHTFTSNLALSASLQPFAGIEKDKLCEHPVKLSSLAKDIIQTKINVDCNGFINVPEQQGLGITINKQAIKKFLIDTEIIINGEVIYKTPFV